jgi:mannitol/fructose-specific phosphotransferase system IIA component (Ntr-type)
LFVREAIITDLKASTKEGVITEILDRLIEVGRVPASERDFLIRCVLAREEFGSTGFGMGLAFPHHRYYPKLERAIVAIARSENGVEFNAVDEEPVTVFVFVICCPRDSYSVPCLIGDILRIEHLRDELMQARTHEQFIDWAERASREVSEPA